MRKNILIGMLFVMLILQTGCGEEKKVYLETETTESAQTDTQETEIALPDSETEETERCYVHVCGAVNNPGVFVLAANSRVYEAIQLAGGLREDASTDTVNQAEYITDGQMLRIPTLEEASGMTESGGQTAEQVDDGLVNINTASEEELMNLPGLGQSKAAAIISYRDEHGGFASIEEVMNVTGIKEGVYNKIKDNIKVN